MSGPLTVICLDGNKYTIDVDEEDIVSLLKTKIQDQAGIDHDKQRILSGGKELKDNERLGDHLKLSPHGCAFVHLVLRR